MTKRHVLHVIDSLAMGGAERMLVEIANQSARDGHHVAVCITRSEALLAAQLHPTIEVKILHRRRRLDGRALREYSAFIGRHQIQVIHAHGRSSFSFAAFARALRFTRLPILLHDHYGIELDDNIPRWFSLWGKRHVARYIGVYQKLGDWAERAGVPSHKIAVIQNALDLRRYTDDTLQPPALNEEDGKTIALMVGGLRREKGLDVLLSALAQLSENHKTQLRVLIAGGAADENYVAQCRRQCADLKLDEMVQFLGRRDDVPHLMRACDFAISPSRSESGPLVLIEFLAAALPTVATSVGGIGKQVQTLGIADMIPPDDAEALGQGISRVLSLSREERRTIGERARQVALQKFDISQVAPLWYQQYDAVL